MERADPIKRGDDATLNITVTDKNGTAQDISGSTLFFALKKVAGNDTDDSTAVLTKDTTLGTTADTQAGIASITLTDSDTNIKPDDYLAEVQIVTSAGTVSSYETFIQPIAADVNRRTA